jgi:hypothetical protein
LVTGFALAKQPVDRQTVLEVCRDFDFLPVPSSDPAAQPATDSQEATRPNGSLQAQAAAAQAVAPRVVDNVRSTRARRERSFFGLGPRG